MNVAGNIPLACMHKSSNDAPCDGAAMNGAMNCAVSRCDKLHLKCSCGSGVQLQQLCCVSRAYIAPILFCRLSSL